MTDTTTGNDCVGVVTNTNNIATRKNQTFTIQIGRDADEWSVVDLLSILDEAGYDLETRLDQGEIVVTESDDDD